MPVHKNMRSAKTIIYLIFSTFSFSYAVYVYLEEKVSPEEIKEAEFVEVFILGTAIDEQDIERSIVDVSARSCNRLLWGADPTKDDALDRLRIEAMNEGADAVINVTLWEGGIDALWTNCWQAINASGRAVSLRK